MIKMFTAQWRNNSSDTWHDLGKFPFEIVENPNATGGSGTGIIDLPAVAGVSEIYGSFVYHGTDMSGRPQFLYDDLNAILNRLVSYVDGGSGTSASIRLLASNGYYIRKAVGGTAWDIYDDTDTLKGGFSKGVPVLFSYFSGGVATAQFQVPMASSPISETGISTRALSITSQTENGQTAFSRFWSVSNTESAWNTWEIRFYFGGEDPVIVPTDPYLPEGVDPSGSGGGTGTFSETGDTVGIPGLPTLSAVDTGFITLFNPTAAQVKSLANYMWSSSFDLTTFKNIVANPIDCILGLSIVPVDPTNAGSKTVSVGNIATNITLPYLSSQYVEVDCGTLNVQEFWGSYLDYSPYTKMSLYLPYIGIIPLDIDDVMNASIAIKYHVDVLSGACVAYVLCNGTQLYTYVGQCSSNVPITSNDFTNTVNGILGIAGSIGKLAADGGASAPTEAAGIAANAINALKPNIQKSGAMSGTGGLMGVQTPYLICQRPRQSVPASQNAYTGYPANITARLSDLSGYTEVDYIHLDGLSATQEEQQEIMDLLTSGVII